MPIRRKLTLVTMLAGVVAVFLATVAMIICDAVRSRQAMLRQLSNDAALLAANSVSALARDDSAEARQVLSTLRVWPEIVQGWLYLTNGAVFAQYLRTNAPQAIVAPTLEQSGWRRERRRLLVFHPVVVGSRPLGTICLHADSRVDWQRLGAYAGVLALVLLVSVLTSALLSLRLRRFITDPVLSLAGVTRAVAEQRNYSLRASKQSADELGELIDGFNQMLSQFQQQDEASRASEERFRQVTESIREVFWMTDVEKAQTLYVSPGYEQIWGRSCASLYQNPRGWIEAIHPEDRERVLHAALTKQVSGEYDEEYRIVQPGGSIRWIRDRAFPVRDENGRVFRIAGIADDVSERKRLERGILEISERERDRFGRDLHDGLCQHLVGIGFASNLLEQKLSEGRRPEAAEAREIATLIDQAITQARHLARGLYPVSLDKESLGLALQELAGSVSKRFHLSCLLEYPAPVAINDRSAALHFYRIAQEAVTNAVKHGRPHRIIIQLLSDPQGIQLRVIDDGQGLSGKKKTATGLGLHIMASRARMMGGTFQMQARREGGMIISCCCPHESVYRSKPCPEPTIRPIPASQHASC